MFRWQHIVQLYLKGLSFLCFLVVCICVSVCLYFWVFLFLYFFGNVVGPRLARAGTNWSVRGSQVESSVVSAVTTVEQLVISAATLSTCSSTTSTIKSLLLLSAVTTRATCDRASRAESFISEKPQTWRQTGPTWKAWRQRHHNQWETIKDFGSRCPRFTNVQKCPFLFHSHVLCFKSFNIPLIRTKHRLSLSLFTF